MSPRIPIEWQRVPPGLSQIFPPLVRAARQHRETGAWLAIRYMDCAVMLCWYGYDGYAAFPFVVLECCVSLDFDENLSVALSAGEKLLKEGPPPCVIEYMESEKRKRQENAREGGYAKAAKSKQRSTKAKPTEPTEDVASATRSFKEQHRS